MFFQIKTSLLVVTVCFGATLSSDGFDIRLSPTIEDSAEFSADSVAGSDVQMVQAPNAKMIAKPHSITAEMNRIDVADDEATTLTSQKRGPRRVSYRPGPPTAEVGASDSFQHLDTVDATGSTNSAPADASDSLTTKLLGEGTPDWIKKGLVLGDDHNLAINSSFFSTIEECKEDLRSRLMAEIHSYLDSHVLKKTKASSIPELTMEYIQKYWVVPSQQYDNIRETNGEIYHQAWIGLHIPSEQLKKVRTWEQAGIRDARTKQAGVYSGIGIATIALLSGLVGVFARREKAKLKV